MMQVARLCCSVLVVAGTLAVRSAHAQSTTEIWSEAAVAWSPIKRATLTLEQKIAFGTEPFAVVEVSPDLAITYGPTKWLRPGTGYRFIERRDKNDNFDAWHRLYGDVTLAPQLGRFKLEYRIRYQSQIPSEVQKNTKNTLRNRLEVGYEVYKGLEPYAGLEMSTRLGGTSGTEWKKLRWAVGVDYTFKPHRLGAFYYLDQEQVDVIEPTVHVFGLSYRYKF